MLLSYLQYVTEKMGGAEGTKLDLDFMEMERVSHGLIQTTVRSISLRPLAELLLI